MSSIATLAIETCQADLLPRVLSAHSISNDQEALDIAQILAAEFRVGASGVGRLGHGIAVVGELSVLMCG